MYEELVKQLRAMSISCGGWKDLYAQAADAIERMDKALEDAKEYESFWEKEANEALRKFQVAVASKPRWIPVTERLPEHEYGESTSVLTVDLYGVMRVTYFDGENWCWPTGEALTTMRVAPITHWMPLPEPPKEET